MACEGKSIEALSIVFTLGIAMGTLLFPPHSTTPGSLLLPLVALPVLLKGPILNLPERQATGIILLTYMLLGMFCASMADIPAAEFSSPIEDLAAKAVSRLRAFIGSLPCRYCAAAEGAPDRRPQRSIGPDGSRIPRERGIAPFGSVGLTHRHYLSDFR